MTMTGGRGVQPMDTPDMDRAIEAWFTSKRQCRLSPLRMNPRVFGQNEGFDNGKR